MKVFLRLFYLLYKKLSKSYAIQLYVGGLNHIEVKPYHSNRLQITTFPFSLSYHTTMQRLINLNIEILIHSGSSSLNNIYKTKNALINAHLLDAVPVLSDIPPYSDLAETQTCVLCSNNVDSWHQALYQLAQDSNLRQEVKRNCREYCKAHFSGKDNVLTLESILQQHLPLGAIQKEARIEKAITLLAQRAGAVPIDLSAWKIRSIIIQRYVKPFIQKHSLLINFYYRYRHTKIMKWLKRKIANIHTI